MCVTVCCCHVQIFTLKVLCTLALSQRESREHVEALVGEGQDIMRNIVVCSLYDTPHIIFYTT